MHRGCYIFVLVSSAYIICMSCNEYFSLWVNHCFCIPWSVIEWHNCIICTILDVYVVKYISLHIHFWMLPQMVFSALAFAQSEVLWYFQHVGIASSKSRAARMIPVEIVRDLHVGFLCVKLIHYYALSSFTVCSYGCLIRFLLYWCRIQVIQPLASCWMAWIAFAA